MENIYCFGKRHRANSTGLYNFVEELMDFSGEKRWIKQLIVVDPTDTLVKIQSSAGMKDQVFRLS